MSQPTTTPTSRTAIDEDPEFWHGLTFWGEKASCQIRESSAAPEYRWGLVVAVRGRADEVFIPGPDARRLRDLLNVAAARGML